MSALLESLQWRYAVKSYDPTLRVSPADLAALQEAIRLAPSSLGLQPYRVLIVEDASVRRELRAASFGQSQITDASHLVVLATENVIDEAYVRSVLLGQAPARIDAALATVGRKSADELRAWAARQAYLALGILLVAAAERRIDANPMEGFLPRRYDEILGLADGGATSVVVAGLGYRSPGDPFQHLPKLRRSAAALFPPAGGPR